ncbi:hypothetical protein NHQ30_001144 [Ciborinia camelliae]|nr:hypothetical protein NHQ30_001144 [Ciborinia camelliae]
MNPTETYRNHYSENQNNESARISSLDSFPPFINQLYATGKYSDLIIKCQGKKFKLHRAIVCSQSKPLSAAIDHGFKVIRLQCDVECFVYADTKVQEATTGEINLEDDEAEIVGYMIDFIYSGSYSIIGQKKDPAVSISGEGATSDQSDGIFQTGESTSATIDQRAGYVFDLNTPSSGMRNSNTTARASTPQSATPMPARNLFGSFYTPTTSVTITTRGDRTFTTPTFSTATGPSFIPGSPIPMPAPAAPTIRVTSSTPNIFHPASTYTAFRNTTGPATESNIFRNRRAEFMRNAATAHPANDELLAEGLIKHAKVYIIAEKYDIQALKELARQKYLSGLVKCWDTSHFVESIELIFDGTPDISKGDGLRNTAVETASKHIFQLLDRKEFVELCQDRGDIATTILIALSKRLCHMS